MINKKKCQSCGEEKLLKELYQYTDESNISITKNSPELCKKCYEKKYDVKIKETPIMDFYISVYNSQFKNEKSN